MNSKLLQSIVILLFVFASSAAAQAPVVRASLLEKGFEAIVETQLDGPLPDNLRRILTDRNNYHLYRIVFDDKQQPVRQEIDLNGVLQPSLGVICSDFNGTCPLVVLRIKNNNAFEPDASYVLEIKGLVSVAANRSDFVPLHLGRPAKDSIAPPKTEVATALDPSRKEIRIVADKDIKVDSAVTITSQAFKISDDKTRLVPDDEVITGQVRSVTDPLQYATTAQSGKEFTVTMDRKLTKTHSHQLSVTSGVKDQGEQTIVPRGKLDLGGAPPAASESKFVFEFKFLSGASQKPFFDFKGSYNARSDIPLGKTCALSVSSFPCYWQPQITADIGFGDTESKKAIVVDLPFRAIIYHEPISYLTDNSTAGANERKIPRYNSWRKASFGAGDIHLLAGPKFEFDQTFDKFNGLASVRTDFKFSRLLGSIKDQQKYLYQPGYTTKEEVSRTRIPFGYSLVPYLAIDAGRRFRSAEVEKMGQTVTTPHFPIFRAYGGFDSALEFWAWGLPMKLGFAERLWYIGQTETIGFTTDFGVDVRRIRGFQHRGTATIDLYFTQARNYSLNITYENGRDAPNFEYLNKVSAGFKVVY